jgi:hypothetical protein
MPSQESDGQSQNQHEYAGISNIYAYIHTYYVRTYVCTYVVLTLTHEHACIHTDIRNNKMNNTRIITIQLTNTSE